MLDARATEHVLGFFRLDRRSFGKQRGKSLMFFRSWKVNKKKKKGEGRKIDERMHEVSVERGQAKLFVSPSRLSLVFSLSALTSDLREN